MLKLAPSDLSRNDFTRVWSQRGISGLNPYNGPPVELI